MNTPIKALIVKEILTLWRDKKSRFFLIVPLLLQLCIFAFAATLDVKNVPVAFLNRDSGKPSFELIQRFRGSPTFRNNFYLGSVEEIQHAIDTQRAAMVLHFDEQFSRNLLAGKPAIVQAILDGRKSNTTQIVLGYAEQIVQTFNVDFANEYGFPEPRSGLVARNWFNPNLLYYWFTVPSLFGVLTMLITILITSLSVARERELGTFDHMLVSPMRPIEILIGKTLPAILISTIEATVMLIVAVFIFQIPFTGSLLLLYGSLLVFISSIVGVGLFISALSTTQQQAVLGTFFFMTPAVLLSGYATPVENMPEWLQIIDYANPLGYFLVVSKGIFLKEMPFWLVLANTWPMAVIALFTFSGAWWFFNRRLE